MRVSEAQRLTCEKYHTQVFEADLNPKVGISKEALACKFPFHGLRHLPEGDTTGWYFWSGEFSDAEDFFLPMHAVHLENSHPWLLKYLALAPGWRILIAQNYEDVSFDSSIVW